MTKMLLPFIPNDTRGVHLNCEICQKKFNILNRAEHKCKRCFRSVCVSCAPERTKTFKQDGTNKEHRVCKYCQSEIRLVLKYHQDFKIKYAQDSEFSTIWVKRLNKQKKPYSAIMAQFSENMSETNEFIQKFKRQSAVLFQELYASYNFSFRHFLELCRGSMSNTQTQESISRVMVSILGKITGLHYFPQMVYMVVFFLCFASECHTYLILIGLFEKVFPQFQSIFKPKRGNLLMKQVKVIVKMIETLTEQSQKDQMSEMKQYLDSHGPRLLHTLTINICNVEVTLHIVHQTLQKVSYLQLYKGIAAIVYLSRDMITSRAPYEQVERHMLKNLTLQMVKTQMGKLQKVEMDTNKDQQAGVSNPNNQKLQALEKMSSFFQQELAKRTAELNESTQKWCQSVKEVQECKQTNHDLQEKLCLLGMRMDELHKYQQTKKCLNQSSEALLQLQNVNRSLRLDINKMASINQISSKKLEEFEYMLGGRGDELIRLQTQNQLLHFKVSAKQIIMDTDHLEKQIVDKAKKVVQLEAKLYQAEVTIRHLNESLEDLTTELSTRKPNSVPNEVTTIDGRQGQVEQFKKQMSLNLQTLKKQKETIEELATIRTLNQNRIFELEVTANDQRSQLQQLNDRLQEMLKLEQKESNSQETVLEMLDFEISKEENPIRKNNLQKIKSRVREYQQEIKVKALDLKIKGNKLQELLNINNQQNLQGKIGELVGAILNIQPSRPNANQTDTKEECLLF